MFGPADSERIVATAQWMPDVNENVAEIALSVADAFQRRGIGAYMNHLIIRLAR